MDLHSTGSTLAARITSDDGRVDTQLLRTFLEVSRTRHFGRAAESLHLTSAAVSARVRQLEEYLGVSLFSRQRGNIQLTDAGQRLLPHAESIINAWQLARDAMREVCPVNPTLRIGIQTVLNQRVLPMQLSAYDSSSSGELDQANLTISYADRQRLQEGLQMQLFDVIVLIDQFDDPNTVSCELGMLKCHLVSDQAERSSRQALQQGYVQMEWGEVFTTFQTQRFGALARPALQTDNLTLAIRYMRERGGACYLPLSIAADYGWLPIHEAPRFERVIQAVTRNDAAERQAHLAAVKRYFTSELEAYSASSMSKS